MERSARCHYQLLLPRGGEQGRRKRPCSHLLVEEWNGLSPHILILIEKPLIPSSQTRRRSRGEVVAAVEKRDGIVWVNLQRYFVATKRSDWGAEVRPVEAAIQEETQSKRVLRGREHLGRPE